MTFYYKYKTWDKTNQDERDTRLCHNDQLNTSMFFSISFPPSTHMNNLSVGGATTQDNFKIIILVSVGEIILWDFLI